MFMLTGVDGGKVIFFDKLAKIPNLKNVVFFSFGQGKGELTKNPNLKKRNIFLFGRGGGMGEGGAGGGRFKWHFQALISMYMFIMYGY